MPKYFIRFIILYFFVISELFAITLEQSVVETIQTNPIIQEKLRIYRAAQQDLKIVESDYYPKLDLQAHYNFNSSTEIIKDTKSPNAKDYNSYGVSLILSHNIFGGFESAHKTKYQEAKILVEAYNYLDALNYVVLNMTKAYINVIRYDEEVKIFMKHVHLYENILDETSYLYKKSKVNSYEVNKASAALALARVMLKEKIDQVENAKSIYRTYLGRMPIVSEMKMLSYQLDIPRNLQSASLYAINNNPSLLAFTYKVKTIQELKKQYEKDFYPKIDVQFEQQIMDVDSPNSYDVEDDRFRAMFTLNYNLYNGEKDTAQAQKHISLINKTIERKRTLKRKLIESLDIAWHNFKTAKSKLQDLQAYKDFANKAYKDCKVQYKKGKKSLLELLMAQKDYTDATLAFHDLKYNSILAQYNILYSMGTLASNIVGQHTNFGEIVNLYTAKKAHFILDTETVKLDVDNDNISDNKDLCDNSILQNNIMPYGCVKAKKSILERPFNKVIKPIKKVKSKKKYKTFQEDFLAKPKKKKREFPKDFDQKNYNTFSYNPLKSKPKPVIIKKKLKVKKVTKRKPVMYGDDSFSNDWKKEEPKIKPGSFIEENLIGNNINSVPFFPSSFTPKTVVTTPKKEITNLKVCTNIPIGYRLDKNGCAKSATITIGGDFEDDLKPLPNNIKMKIEELVYFLKQNKNIDITIVGHSSRSSSSNANYNLTLSKKRAQRFKGELLFRGIGLKRIKVEGKGFSQPIADNKTFFGRKLNRRIEILFKKH